MGGSGNGNGIGRYELGRVLGRGRFGKVCFARHKDSKASVAIKIIDKDSIIPNLNIMTFGRGIRVEDYLRIKREISTMKLIKHSHVVQLLEVLASKKKVYIVLEYVGGGELYDKILDAGKLSEEEAHNYFQQLIGAVDYCHSRGVYHRDLKPENLLLDTRGNLKISDFGLSAFSQQCSDDGLLHTACGTPNYLAPEVLHGNGYDGALADLWSCGIILYVLLAGFLPFDEPNTIALYRKVNQAEFSFPSWFSSGARSLIKKILNPNAKKRITIPEILNDDWFKIGYTHMRGFEKDVGIDDIDWVFEKEKDTEKSRPPLVNAFEIISMSPSLNLSGLFKEQKGVIRSETLFATKEPAKELISDIEDFAKSRGFNVKEKNYRVRLQNTHPGRKGCLSIASEVFEVGPSLFMVRMKKTSGDTLEYNDFHKKLTITLKDVVWKNDEETTGA